MSLWFFLKLFFYIIYSFACIILTLYIYYREKHLYYPIYIKKRTRKGKDDKTIVNLHDQFEEFARRESGFIFEDIQYLSFFGPISIGLATIFVDRDNEEFKKNFENYYPKTKRFHWR